MIITNQNKKEDKNEWKKKLIIIIVYHNNVRDFKLTDLMFDVFFDFNFNSFSDKIFA